MEKEITDRTFEATKYAYSTNEQRITHYILMLRLPGESSDYLKMPDNSKDLRIVAGYNIEHLVNECKKKRCMRPRKGETPVTIPEKRIGEDSDLAALPLSAEELNQLNELYFKR